ncbi:hypothetical protein NBRC3188_1703 [Acetobacter pasteurianus NBRC 3188]|uniref:Uncharacterized protein n=1 Tax=Acetobacter pasteurianus NBRC 3188 TaxID=1226663 RepID=A0A401WUN6_ACEPA|nr:hypothetical protein NBRC3188_1703 [Acetobacter pasteurianus NBRC 3188]
MSDKEKPYPPRPAPLPADDTGRVQWPIKAPSA